LFPIVQVASTTERRLDVAHVRQALGLDWRLAQVPERAQVRGWFFRQTRDAVARHGRLAMAVYRRLSPVKSTWFFRMYSCRDYLEDAAAGAAAIDAVNPHSALRAIWRNAPRYAQLFNAQRFMALLLNASPFDALRWLEGHRDMFVTYGDCRLERRDERYFVVHYFDEYIWLESAHLGGVEGLLDACNVASTVDVDLDSPFSGRIHVRWRPR
jgi:hypothetical protein